MNPRVTRPEFQAATSRQAARALVLAALTACALLLGCGASDRGATEPTAQVQQRQLNASSPFVTRAGVELRIDGQPFHFAGTNNYYLWYAPLEDIGTDKNVREIFEDAKAMGLTVIRTWGFGDGDEGWGYTLQPSPGVYDETGFAHFDQVLAMAAEYDIRLVIPLINNWDDFGGMQRYVDWTGGGEHDDFYTRQECQDLYKAYVDYFINRTNTVTGVKYKDDPTIMAWELANEPRAMTAGPAVLDVWIGEMSDYIRTLDPNHLIGTGSEGFYNGRSGFTGWPYDGSQGVDFIANHSHPNIDFTSIHVYPDYWDLDPLQTLEWFNVHVDDSRHVLDKPIIVGEFGKTNTTQEPNIRDATMAEWYRLFESQNFAGDMFWILYGDAYPDYDGFGIYYPTDASTVDLIEAHANVMNAKVAQSASVDEVALAESTGEGTVTGSYLDTRFSDGSAEALTEQTTNGAPNKRTSVLEHTWQFWVTQGTADPVLRVRAHHTANLEGDDFLLQYSTDGIQFSDALTVTKTADDGSEQNYTLPSNARERLWIRVVDTDQSGGNTSPDTLFVDYLVVTADGIDIEPNEPPSVSIDAPTDGSVVSGSVAISAAVTDPEGLGAVDYAVDDGAYAAMTYDAVTTEYTASWDTSGASQGSHTIWVRATDTGGQTVTQHVTVQVDYYPNDDDPVVSIVLPTDGSQVSGDAVLIQATATDDVGVDHVDYAIDGGAWTGMSDVGSDTWQAAWDSTPLANGDHDVAVRATDTVGQTSALSAVTVEVVNVGGEWVHVQNIAMNGKKMGKNYQANANVLIVNSSGQPAEGVTVTTEWSGASPLITRTDVTDATGTASTYSDRGPAGTYTVTVTGLSCAGCYYDEAANVESSDSIVLN